MLSHTHSTNSSGRSVVSKLTYKCASDANRQLLAREMLDHGPDAATVILSGAIRDNVLLEALFGFAVRPVFVHDTAYSFHIAHCQGIQHCKTPLSCESDTHSWAVNNYKTKVGETFNGCSVCHYAVGRKWARGQYDISISEDDNLGERLVTLRDGRILLEPHCGCILDATVYTKCGECSASM